VLDDYKVLRLRGCTQDEIALRLGMKVTSLRQALRRARIAGKQVAA
jgi:DNA-directed RNA polymerase specialized sigma24 family protein